MDEEGHVPIADYGLAVGGLWDDKRTTGVAGTRGFMAPEVVNSDFYQFEPGWFSLGVITYILATKHMPFRSMTFDEYRREVNFSHPNYLPEMDPDLADFRKGPMDMEMDDQLSPSAIMPKTSKYPGEEIYLPMFTYINSMWACM
ncbi:G protein-coupled receptor kinase 4-like [Aquarana catesbeiana]|uniref:G protein-coupled receptor kinase 4-like n=1 Tax=Aquarana catesbeiana TaxID=8400 RepID=UPI003CC930B7